MSKLITSTHLFCYVYVKTARVGKSGKGEPKYEATVVIPKDHPDVQRIEDAIAEVYEQEKNGKFKGLPLTSRKFSNPLRDGDEYIEDNPATAPDEYAGCYFIKGTSNTQPKLWDADGTDVYDIDEQIYSGMFGRAELVFWPYNNESVGITVFLNSIKKTRDGDRLTGGSSSATIDAYDEEDYSEDAAPKRGAGRSTATSRAPKAAAGAKPAAKKPVRIWDEDEDGTPIYSDNGGKNWFYED